MTPKRQPIEYADASAAVRAVHDDIMTARKTDWVNGIRSQLSRTMKVFAK
jgi:hypothetical protein